MPLTKAKGQMYSWVSHLWNPLGGACGHLCSYCYLNSMKKRYPELAKKYSGEPRLIESELVPLGKGKTIFVCNCNDLFAGNVTIGLTNSILLHCCKYAGNKYVFQTKSPENYEMHLRELPPISLLGCTIETTEETGGNAPSPLKRAHDFKEINYPKFLTIEPIMKFDLNRFLVWIAQIKPAFINIGADSKGNGLAEPSLEEVQELIDGINKLGIEIRVKDNLERLLPC